MVFSSVTSGEVGEVPTCSGRRVKGFIGGARRPRKADSGCAQVLKVLKLLHLVLLGACWSVWESPCHVFHPTGHQPGWFPQVV